MNRSVRLLVPWLDSREAVSSLIGFRLPVDGEDIGPALRIHRTQQSALAGRPPHNASNAAVSPLPESLAARGEAFLRALRFDGGTVRLGIVDLAEVIAFQKVVALDAIDERVNGIREDDLDKLFDLCLPDPRPSEQIDGTFDRDGKGLTITSLNPNLRVSALQQAARPAAGAAADQIVGFSITFGSTHVHMTEYNGRLYLKDGYHRCYALLAKGIRRIPCVVSTGRSFLDVVGTGNGHISQEHLTGPRPPLLTDFLDDSVSMTLPQRAMRKVVRIHAEEFVAQM